MQVEEKNGEILITDFNELEAYKISRKVENDGLEFYKEMLKSSDNPKTSEILQILVDEEKKHLKYFENSIFKLRENVEEQFEDDDLMDFADTGIFPSNDQQELSKLMNDPKKVLEVGMVMEMRSINLYKSFQENVSDENTKSELQNIIDEELKHKELIKGLAKTL
ncbi:MAG: ferritin family protein [Candidatus Aureabacteria bacterium]|nr:ferritin family protein [Candidatus Auribacterota bacterium]